MQTIDHQIRVEITVIMQMRELNSIRVDTTLPPHRIYKYNEVWSVMHMLQSLYTHHYIICGGDWNTYFTRKTSFLTKSLVSFCDYEGLTCVNLVSNAQQFIYVSDINGSKSLIDNFIISDNLRNYVNSSDVRDDIDNHSDHLPITMYLHISIPI